MRSPYLYAVHNALGAPTSWTSVGVIARAELLAEKAAA
jgi:hypothetical protein